MSGLKVQCNECLVILNVQTAELLINVQELLNVSPELARIIGTKKGEKISRSEVGNFPSFL